MCCSSKCSYHPLILVLIRAHYYVLQDVFLTSGASHALDLCIALLGSKGKNILIPRPGFPLYKTLCSAYGVETRPYNLLPDSDWEVDTCQMQSLIDSNTVAIIYNNPSNPCGSVFSSQHISEILLVAQKHCIPIIADEIYENMVFPGETFIPIASLTSEVPVLSCRGTTKRFLIPGMRLGWITLHDRKERFGEQVCALPQILFSCLVHSHSLSANFRFTRAFELDL